MTRRPWLWKWASACWTWETTCVPTRTLLLSPCRRRNARSLHCTSQQSSILKSFPAKTGNHFRRAVVNRDCRMLRGHRAGEQTPSSAGQGSPAAPARPRQRWSGTPELLVQLGQPAGVLEDKHTERPREDVASPPRVYRARHPPHKQGRRDGSCCQEAQLGETGLM